MNLSDQKLNEILKKIIDDHQSKGSITTNSLCDIMEKYETTPNQMDYVYKSIAESGIQIIDEAERDNELYEQALSDIGLDDPVKMYLKDIGRVPLLSADDEIELARRMQEGDEDAKKETLRSQPSPCRLNSKALCRQGHALFGPHPGGQPRSDEGGGKI